MTWYLVLSIGLSCPGGMLSGFIPQAIRPYVCTREPRAEIIPREADAHARVRQIGPGARLMACRGLRCRDVRVEWSQVAKIGGE